MIQSGKPLSKIRKLILHIYNPESQLNALCLYTERGRPSLIKLCPKSSKLTIVCTTRLLNILYKGISQLLAAVSIPDSLLQTLPQIYKGPLKPDLIL